MIVEVKSFFKKPDELKCIFSGPTSHNRLGTWERKEDRVVQMEGRKHWGSWKDKGGERDGKTPLCTLYNTYEQKWSDRVMELRMARVETDTGREVFIAEGQHFCNWQFGEQRGEREWGREVRKGKSRDQQVFTPDGASSTVERREIESEALLCNDRTLKGWPLGRNWEKYWKTRRDGRK